jgi:nitroimidazol reductase NimA-like FMN-containing flavoprotein (pyridoxamine 5'-phosphate oxidase superfamily)
MTTEVEQSEPDDGVYAANTRGTYTRRSDHARYDAQAINSLLDEALFCHVGYVDGGDPIVVPVIHTRVDETLYLHTATGSRLAQLASVGTRLCVTVSLLDGLVLARSQVGHNVNYRSVVARGEGVLVTDDAEKLEVTAAVVEHIVARRRAGPHAAGRCVVEVPDRTAGRRGSRPGPASLGRGDRGPAQLRSGVPGTRSAVRPPGAVAADQLQPVGPTAGLSLIRPARSARPDRSTRSTRPFDPLDPA